MNPPVTTTTVKVPYSVILKNNLLYGLKISGNKMLGRLYPLVNSARTERANKMLKTLQTKERLRNHGPLSKELVDEWMDDNLTRVEGTVKRKLVHHAVNDENMSDPAKQSVLQRGAFLVFELIRKNPDLIDSAVNIGARIDPTMSYLAGKFPDKTFTSIDMQSNIAEINKDLPQHDNWHFISGYAHDVFRDTDFSADLVFMTSTATKLNTDELKAYLELFRQKAKFLVFNEPFWALPLGFHSFRLVKPEEIDPNKSLIGGFVGDYHHNYPAILPQHGFELLVLEILPGYRSSGGWTNNLRLVAVNRDKVKDEVTL